MAFMVLKKVKQYNVFHNRGIFAQNSCALSW